jgi:fructoselysine-6-P-deglycase FrlB-like protein
MSRFTLNNSFNKSCSTDIQSISLVGCGSSYNAALYGAKLLRHTGAFTAVSAMDANSADEYDFRFLGDPSQQVSKLKYCL